MIVQISPEIRHIVSLDPNNVRKNGRSEHIALGIPDEPYYYALAAIPLLDRDLTRGVRHYRTKAGELLKTLDQVVVAIIAGELLEPEG